jgi:TonB family protein
MSVALLALISIPVLPPAGIVPRSEIVSFTPGAVSCADGPVVADGLVKPFTTVTTRYGPAASPSIVPSYRFSFAIDAQGRARTIRRAPIDPSPVYVDTSDLAPALAASRFPAGRPRTGCSVRFAGSVSAMETASMPALYELASRPATAGNAPTLLDRVRPEGSNCSRGPGQYRRLNLPSFEKLKRPDGSLSWLFLAYDVDEAGKPGNIRILGSSGDPGLDRAGQEALAANRYAPGAGYHGCTYHFYNTGGADRPAPELGPDAPVDTDDQPGCSVDPKSIKWLTDGSAYPRPFSRRRIEGVAVIGYDTAPWGAVGNVKVLAAEPDEMFGDAARNAMTNARVDESDTGRRGCVQRVRFKLPGDDLPQ